MHAEIFLINLALAKNGEKQSILKQNEAFCGAVSFPACSDAVFLQKIAENSYFSIDILNV